MLKQQWDLQGKAEEQLSCDENVNAGRDQTVSSVHNYRETDVILELLCIRSHLRADQCYKNIWHWSTGHHTVGWVVQHILHKSAYVVYTSRGDATRLSPWPYSLDPVGDINLADMFRVHLSILYVHVYPNTEKKVTVNQFTVVQGDRLYQNISLRSHWVVWWSESYAKTVAVARPQPSWTPIQDWGLTALSTTQACIWSKLGNNRFFFTHQTAAARLLDPKK